MRPRGDMRGGTIRGGVALSCAVALGLAAIPAAAGPLVQPAQPVVPPPVILLAAPGSNESYLRGMDRAGRTLAFVVDLAVNGTSGYATDEKKINTLQIWDVDGREPRLRKALRSYTLALHVLADETRVAVSYNDGFDLLDLRTGDRTATFPMAASVFASARDGTLAAARGTEVLVVGPDGRERWRAKLDGEAWGVRRVYTGPGSYHTNDPIRVPVAARVLAFDPDDPDRLAVGCSDGSVRLFAGGKQLSSAAVPPPPVRYQEMSGAVSPVGLIWRHGAIDAVAGHGQLVRFPLAPGPVKVLHDGTCTAADKDQALAQFGDDRSEGASLHWCQITGHAVASPDGRSILQVGGSGVRIRDLATGKGVGFVRQVATQKMVPSADGRHLWFGNVSGGIHEEALAAGEAKRVLPATGAGGFVRIYPSRDLVAVFVTDGVQLEPDVWLRTHLRTYHLDGRPRGLRADTPILHVAAAADRALVQETDGSVLLTDLEGTVLARVQPPVPKKQFSDSALSADGRTIAIAADDHLFVLPPGGVPRPLQVQGIGTVEGLAFSTDGRRLFVRRFRADTFMHAVAVVDVASDRVLFQDPTRHGASAMSPDGRSVAYVREGALVVRGVDRGEERGRLVLERLDGVELADADTLVYSTDEGILSWRLGSKPVRIGPRALSPNITADGGLIFVDDHDRGTHVLHPTTGHRVTVHALVSGGFTVMDLRGAIDGTDDIRSALVVRRANDLFVPPEPAAWPAILTRGLLPRAVAGR